MDATFTNILFTLRERFLTGISSVCKEHPTRLAYVIIFIHINRNLLFNYCNLSSDLLGALT